MAETPESDKLSQVVRIGFIWFANVGRDTGSLDWVRIIESAFISCVSEDAAEHTFYVLQGVLAQVIFVGDCLKHPAGIHRSELPQLNLNDAIGDVRT